jgi:hypothetical protein
VSREPVRPRYDAVVDLFPVDAIATHAYAVVKFTYAMVDGKARLIEALPLQHDIRDPDLQPRWPPGSDFWPFKFFTDVIVLGSAYPRRAPAPHRQISVKVGKTTKRIDVWGKRFIEWRNGKPLIGPPEPFEKMPVVIENAYGGADRRVPVKDGPLTVADHERLQADHPGMYPRNPLGKGYVVVRDPVDGVELPNLEDPDHPLTPERLIVGDAKAWWKQPLPWSLDWTHKLMWPRVTSLGVDAWFPSPEGVPVEEVRRGFLLANWRERMKAADPTHPIAPEFFQEGSLGLVLGELPPGTPVVIDGMHPEGKPVAFALPAPPRMEFDVEGRRHTVKPRLTSLVIEPELERFSMTYAADTDKLHRAFIPGVHGKIPLAVKVEDDLPILYETPVPIRERVKQAEAEGKAAKPNARRPET